MHENVQTPMTSQSRFSHKGVTLTRVERARKRFKDDRLVGR